MSDDYKLIAFETLVEQVRQRYQQSSTKFKYHINASEFELDFLGMVIELLEVALDHDKFYYRSHIEVSSDSDRE